MRCSVGSTLNYDLDREWAIRHGCEEELVAMTVMLLELGKRLGTSVKEEGLKGGRRRTAYAASGRLIRLITAVQKQLLSNNKHHYFCESCKRLKRN